MDNRINNIVNNFVSQGEKRLFRQNTDLAALKRIYEDELVLMRDLLKIFVKLTNENKFGTATMHAAHIEYDMKAQTATLRQAVTVNDTQHYMHFVMSAEKTVVDDKEFGIGSQETPYAYIKHQFDSWLQRDFIFVPFKT